MKRLLLFVFIALCSGNIYSQERLLAWQFNTTDQNSAGTEETYAATSLHPSLSGSVLKRGSGFKGSGLARAFSSATSFTVVGDIPKNQSDAVTANAYLEFEVSSRIGAKLNLTELRANIRCTATGHNKYVWRYSVNGAAFQDIFYTNELSSDNADGQIAADGAATAEGGKLVVTNLSGISDLQNIDGNTKVVFRLYGWGSASTGLAGSFALGRSTAGDTGYYPLAVHGTVTADNEKTLLGFDLASNPPNDGMQVSSSATTVNGNINPSSITRGDGLIPMSSTIIRSIASNIKDYETVTRANLADAITQNDYYQFTINGKTGYITSLSSLDVTLRRSSTGATKYQWRYSIDGSSFFDVGGTGDILLHTVSLAQPKVDLSGVAELQNVPSTTTVTFRLYVWGTTAATGNIAIGRYGASDVANSLAVGGSVSVVTPVKLTSFTATPQANSVQLRWSTASETNNSHFEVLRSNGDVFKAIGSVKGNGNATVVNHYQYTDRQPLAGISYYQLRQVDYNGDTELSEIVTVKNQLNLQQTEVYASLQQQKITANFFAEKTGTTSLSIIDLTGRKIAVKNVLAEGNKLNSAEIEGVLKKGVYILEIALNGQTQHKKFIVQ